MALQNQTFASATPSATLTSVFSIATNSMNTELRVESGNEDFSSEDYWYMLWDHEYSHAPPGLSYTVQQAIGFNEDFHPYSSMPEGYHDTIRLASDGCTQPSISTGKEVHDCSISCVSPNIIFNNTPTMANCIAYGLIAELLVSGNVSDSFKQTAMDYGISANLTTAAQVKSIMLQCSNQCRALQTGGASYDFPTNSTITYEELPEALSDMCLDVVAPALPDIAGIGV